VLCPKLIENGEGGAMVARLRGFGGFDEAVGHAAHGRNDRDAGRIPCGCRDDLRRSGNARSVAHRGTAKFHDL